MIEYRKWITRQMLRDEPEKLFVFGDNMMRAGYGGQAREMRGEPNAVGIPTKWSPGMDPEDFFTDDDFTDQVKYVIDSEAQKLLRFEGTIVWPSDGIGTGLAELPTRAPKIWDYLEKVRIMLTFDYHHKFKTWSQGALDLEYVELDRNIQEFQDDPLVSDVLQSRMEAIRKEYERRNVNTPLWG